MPNSTTTCSSQIVHIAIIQGKDKGLALTLIESLDFDTHNVDIPAGLRAQLRHSASSWPCRKRHPCRWGLWRLMPISPNLSRGARQGEGIVPLTLGSVAVAPNHDYTFSQQLGFLEKEIVGAECCSAIKRCWAPIVEK